MNNDYMYAIERNDDYLAHYGIKGMKWGVRKAIESGNGRRLDRQYRKAQKKLAKLERRANSGAKYARRAAALGAGAAAAGGLAALGTKGLNNAMRGVGGAMQTVGRRAQMLAATPGAVNPRLGVALAKGGIGLQGAGSALKGAGMNVKQWGRSTSISRGAGDAVSRLGRQAQLLGADPTKVNAAVGSHLANASRGLKGAGNSISKSAINNNTIARLGAGALGVGLAGAAGYNAYRAATTKRAARKAAQFRNEMNKAFAGTKYANGGGNRQGKKRRRG